MVSAFEFLDALKKESKKQSDAAIEIASKVKNGTFPQLLAYVSPESLRDIDRISVGDELYGVRFNPGRKQIDIYDNKNDRIGKAIQINITHLKTRFDAWFYVIGPFDAPTTIGDKIKGRTGWYAIPKSDVRFEGGKGKIPFRDIEYKSRYHLLKIKPHYF